jgi:hypothetical protein
MKLKLIKCITNICEFYITSYVLYWLCSTHMDKR